MSSSSKRKRSASSSSHRNSEHERSRSRLAADDTSGTSADSRSGPANSALSSSAVQQQKKTTGFGFKLKKAGSSAAKSKMGGFSFGNLKPKRVVPNVFASAALGASKARSIGAKPTSPTSNKKMSAAEKFRLRKERLAALMKRKKEEEALAAMSPEERRKYEREQQLERVRREIEEKDRALAAAEAERRRRQQEAAAAAADPLEQFMQQLTSSDAEAAQAAAQGTADGASGLKSSIQPSRDKPIQTISFEDIVKEQQRAQSQSAAPAAADGSAVPAAAAAAAGGSAATPTTSTTNNDDDEEAEDSDSGGIVGGSFLDAMDGSHVAVRNMSLEKLADEDGSQSDAGVDDETFHEEFRKAWKRRQEAERRQAEANRIEEEKQRELEEKERLKQEKAQESLGVIYGDADADGAAEYAASQGKGKSALDILREKMKKKELKKVDHSQVAYVPIKKAFYREHPDVSKMQPATVRAHLKRMEIKVRGKNAPKPILKWSYAGLDARVLLMCEMLGFAAPFAIQAMAIPALMSGRDIIGVAKTGSGKTVAFLLPLFRHVLDQPKLADGEGPIGLIMAPARELAVQIYRETKKFTKVLNMRTVAVYGGSPVSEQINAMKRGAEIVVATPGRFIDLLTLNAGKLISLARVSYLVLDEADRMFDMGFEPQIAMVTKNIRPDRQTAMFSATFPSHVEKLARKLLRHKPLEIIVGGRSKVASEIEQFVEVRNDQQKFLRLLQILGLWQGKGSVLIFTDTQELCDRLFTRLTKAGYYCLSLHSGKDQADRDQTIADFKNVTRDIMVATSLAGRGLDVKTLSLVVNYSCPNHLEDYVQRCGRTGRAGNKGTAYTFIDPVTEEQFVPDVVKALNESGVDVPQPVLDLQEQFLAKVKAGTAKKAISGYKGKGHKFDADEAGDVAVEKEIQKMRHEVGAGIRDAGDLVEAEMQLKQMIADKEQKKEEKLKAAKDGNMGGGRGDGANASASVASAAPLTMDPAEEAKLRAQIIAQRVSSGGKLADFDVEAAVRAAKLAMARTGVVPGAAASSSSSSSSSAAGAGGGASAPSSGFEEELEINEYPHKARFRVMHRDCIQATQEFTGTAIIPKGVFVAPGRKPKDGERKLYLLIQGPTAISVKRAKADLLRVLEEVTMEIGFDKSMIAGKYSVA